jgi:hypothetical protein
MHSLRQSDGLMLLALAAFLGAACSDPASSAPPRVAEVPVHKLILGYSTPPVVGTVVTASATGLPAGTVVDLQWATVTGGWVVEDYYHFRGKKYSDTKMPLGSFAVDGSGRFEATFKIPEDYGGVHDVIAVIDDIPMAQNGIEVTQSFELSPTSGPVGTPVELRVKGLGWRTMESTWVVNWDNNAVGWVSAAGTRGSAVARFRASGPAGDHVIKVYTGWQGQAYLNHEQSPVAHLPRPEFTFRTIPGNATIPAAVAEPYPRQPIPETHVSLASATLALIPAQGPVGTRAVLQGTGFPTGETLTLAWQTTVGNRVTTDGFLEQEIKLSDVKVGSDGRIDVPIDIPDDVGGLHRLVLRDDDRTVAQAHFAIETSIVSIAPTSGPVGTPVTIHLKGVGWTDYDNIYVATYDNAYMGYACGFNSHGDVVINFVAAGQPGVHLIDLYPGIYQGPSTEPQLLYRTPQLTYADDHPGNRIPALRFSFQVIPSAPVDTR